jgi:uncharacterized membrane protein
MPQNEEIEPSIAENVQNKDKDSNLLAGLCYIPVFLINIIAILYVLLAKKGGQFAKFHALQGLFLAIVYFIFIMIIELPFFIVFFKSFSAMQGAFFAGGDPVDMRNQIMAEQTRVFVYMIPAMILGFLYFIGSLVLAFIAFSGKKFRLPVLARLVDKVL